MCPLLLLAVKGEYMARLRLGKRVGIYRRKNGGILRWTFKWVVPEQSQLEGLLMT